MPLRERPLPFGEMPTRDSFGIDVVIISTGLLEPGSIRGGGCETNDFNVASQLSKKFDVVLIGPYFDKFLGSKSVNDHFTIEYVPFPALGIYPLRSKLQLSLMPVFLTLFYSVAVAAKIMRLLRRSPGILIVHSPYSAALALVIARFSGLAVVYSEGNITPWYDPVIAGKRSGLFGRHWRALNLALSKSMCAFSDRIRSQSESIRNAMIESGIDSEKIEVISTGESAADCRLGSKSCDESHSPGVAFIGRLTDEKGVPLLLEICHKSKRDLPEVQFYIFGDGPYGDAFLGMPNVAHLGSVSRNELFERLEKVHIVLSFQKELGRAEIECLARGKILIACNAGETPRIIRHGENGMLCGPDASSYMNAIGELARSRELRERLSQGARVTAKENFDLELIGDQWRRLCEGLMNDHVSQME